jgi:putative ABC transport system permease protein
VSKNITSPRWAQILLRKFANTNALEEIEGDLSEFLIIWEKQHGIGKARWKYIRTVFTLLRPFKKRQHSYNQYSISTSSFMMASYFKMSWRSMLRHKVSSLINMSGLTIGLATSILILLVVMSQLKYDQFHSNLPSIYLLMKNQKTNEGISTGWSTAGPMAEAFRSDYPEVKYVSRVARFNDLQVIANDKSSYQSGIYADPDLFRMMTFPAATGDVLSSLETNSAIAITRDMAKKLFANENPIGKQIQFNRRSFTIGAVLENTPYHSTLKFDIVVPFAVFEKENDWLKKWDDNRIMTWIQLHPSADISSFNNKVTDLLQKRSDDKTVSLFAYPLKELYLHGNFSNGHPNGGRINGLQILVGFGVFMLLIACVNFMNIATAQSEHRAKEIGVRKVLGASRKWIIFQFLNESFLITFLSLFTAVGLATLVTPSFNILTHSNISLDLTNFKMWLSLFTIGLVTSLLAGSYPSLFLSRFMPARILKGRITNLKSGGVRRALVTFQFMISVACLIGTIIMYSQFQYVKDRPLGYDQENLIDIHLDSALSARFSYLKSEVLKISNVRSATGSSENILYSGGAVTGMDWPGKRPDEDLSIVIADVEYNWSKTMDVKILAGRDFDPAFTSDVSACLLNESAVVQMGLQNPVGSVVGGHPVIGVIQNYVYNNPSGQISPMAIYLNPQHLNHLYLRIQNDSQWRRTIGDVEKIMKSASPDFPFTFSFTKEEYQNHFNEFSNIGLMVSIFGGLIIFISCLGLFGLAGFIAEKRSKEMSIRKVFGASILRIFGSLSHDFLRPVVYALLFVLPLSIFTAKSVLANISYRVPLSWWMFGSAAVLIICISLLIVVYHALKTAKENPVVRLRNE